MASITCTNCGAVLKTKDPVPPGKKVKCPKCAQAFVVPEEEKPEEPVAADAGDAAGFTDDAAPKKDKTFALDDDEEGDKGDEGDKSKKGGKGGDGKKSNKTLILVIVAAVLVFCCCPSVCGTIYSIFATSINAAIGLDAAVKKAQEDALKAKKN